MPGTSGCRRWWTCCGRQVAGPGTCLNWAEMFPSAILSLRTSQEWIYVAGDAAGVEEASAAMVEGRLAGAAAAKQLGADVPAADEIIARSQASFVVLRGGGRWEKRSVPALPNWREG